MKRYYCKYELWEDYKNGMYDLEKDYSEKEMEILAHKVKLFLTNYKHFYEIGMKMVSEWKYATKVNLTNKNRNRQAWIGQASCCYELKIPERITKLGWRLMNFEQQQSANKIADEIIFQWENNGQKKIIEKRF